MSLPFDIKKFAAPLGAEIINLDLNLDFDRRVRLALQRSLANYGLLLIRGQYLEPNRHVELASCFGIPEAHDFVPGLDSHHMITEIRKMPEQIHNFGSAWHFDLTFRPSPPVAAVLVARQIPQLGGDTIWANQYLAYEALDVTMRMKIDTLCAIHSSQQAFGNYAGNDTIIQAQHPLAPLHAVSGRRHLFANPVAIDTIIGMEDAAAQQLLSFLYRHATDKKFQYRHHWQEGDIIMWDNRATMHRAMNDYAGEVRIMHRISVREG